MSGTDRLVVHNKELGHLIKDDYSVEDIRTIRGLLDAHGTLEIPQLPNGLYAASGAIGGDADLTGYHNTWVRDTMMIAHSDWHTGKRTRAVKTVRAVLDFYKKHRHRFIDIIEGRKDPDDPMNRPHIRFDGNTLEELPERWAHAQNDALGYFLGLASFIAAHDYSDHPPREDYMRPGDIETLSLFPAYFHAIQYWKDQDSGHWEEARKVNSSSIGVARYGLVWYTALLSVTRGKDPAELGEEGVFLENLMNQGNLALQWLLPHESKENADPTLDRDVDGAQTFLTWPTETVAEEVWPHLLNHITSNLGGDYGIKRYNGDSYWCADYRQLLSAEERCADFSDDMSERDAMLKPGTEAQWCIFDPAISAAYGLLYSRTGEAEYRERQAHHLNRALGQVTGEGMNVAAWQCPEMYYLEDSTRGDYVPNDNTPLRWTQANLKAALHSMEVSLKVEKHFEKNGNPE